MMSARGEEEEEEETLQSRLAGKRGRTGWEVRAEAGQSREFHRRCLNFKERKMLP